MRKLPRPTPVSSVPVAAKKRIGETAERSMNVCARLIFVRCQVEKPDVSERHQHGTSNGPKKGWRAPSRSVESAPIDLALLADLAPFAPALRTPLNPAFGDPALGHVETDSAVGLERKARDWLKKSE
jgi:uncharacterized membrane protein